MFKYFNTTKGIMKHVVDLASLHVLINDRRAWKILHPEYQLNEFVLWGWLILDKFAQVNFIDQIVKKVSWTDLALMVKETMPDVISMTEFKKRMSKLNVDHWHIIVNAQRNKIPNANTLCPGCHKGWTLENIRDCESEDYSFLADELSLHVRKDIRDDIASRLALYMILNGENCSSEQTQNIIIKTLSEKTHSNWGILSQNDKIHTYVHHDVYHRACYQAVIHKTTCQQFEKAFRNAGINIFGQIRIKNEYGSENRKGPWFIFDTEYGLIKVGWRRHVILVDYRFITSDYLSCTIETSGPGFEHVYDYEKLTDALFSFSIFMKQHRSIKDSLPVVSLVLQDKQLVEDDHN